ncbi:molybdopterin molybdotransferase MoeA [Motilimonas pumila]|uniref:Molybdopterin molybdenumtransferase n=1 Tax=Motilimonas pumila TaxID=2303987 RepID=A0A418YG26_9GAMM|nr:molybdopterin molybdotransferase MoeA [Motilimonas pumila]RJG48495.1 molybdopterin molybdotransferase [Motilimonas pumila]
MGCCDTPGLKPVEQALQEMLNSVSNQQAVINVDTPQALGTILANDVTSPVNVPAFDNSAMDGYAFRAADLAEKTTLTLVGTAFAGTPFEGNIPQGGCIRIMTGAPVPSSLDTVEMQENVTANGDRISFNHGIKVGQHIRRLGEDIQLGQAVLNQGKRLTPRDIPLIASLGIATLAVYHPLSVAIFSTGDELKPVGTPLAHGQIYDSNRYSLHAVLQNFNVNIIDYGIIPDDLDALRKVFNQANNEADVVITSGGVSVGEADYTKTVLDELGEIGFWKLAIKPGKPFAFGKLSHSVFFGLPGNPVSALVTLVQLAIPTMRAMAGETPAVPARFQAISQTAFKKSPGRTDFQRGIYHVNAQGQIEVASTGAQGSGVFSSMSASNCFIILEQERGAVAAGETVTIEPYDHLLQ